MRSRYCGNRSATVTSLTLDEAIGTASASSKAYFTKFRKAHDILSTREEDAFARASIDKKSPWIKIKMEIRGFDPVVYMLELTNSVDKSAQ